MNIKISSPEILFVSACVLFLMDKTTPGAIFTALGVVGSISRVVLEAQVRQERIKSNQDALKMISGAAAYISKLFSSITVQHYDDSTDYN